ncbi:MAG: winged helix-turn-helix transcriptional regulator, partial [Planctomycetes bacterium]|nr:winged helix-turn-helix transcriptional regulator [Planctomycetota bacterium]
MDNLGDHLRLFADDTRLRILHLLATEPLTVAELQDVLELSQSSISGHLAKLKHAGLIHDLAEGSARRYRMREDTPERLAAAWKAVRELSLTDPRHAADRHRLDEVRDGGDSWVERMAGSLHRAYAPGRTWESLCHGMVQFARFGRAVDVG